MLSLCQVLAPCKETVTGYRCHVSTCRYQVVSLQRLRHVKSCSCRLLLVCLHQTSLVCHDISAGHGHHVLNITLIHELLSQSERILMSLFARNVTTVVPVMNGHPRDQAKVSVHDRRPLVRGTEGRAGGGAKRNTGNSVHDYITTSDIRTEYTCTILRLNTMACIVIIMT